jgi:hypothetical protein
MASSKWSLHRFYSWDPAIRPLLPQTALFTRPTLVQYLHDYGAVYIKPDLSHMGKGIIKAWRTSHGYAFVRMKGKPRLFTCFDAFYQSLLRATGGKRCIVQQAIPLAKVKGRPFDVRVLMFRNAKEQWEFCGTLARVAAPSSVITNACSSGSYVLPLETALARSLGYNPARSRAVVKKLEEVSHSICKRFNKYKFSYKIGNDFAIDRGGRIWLLEVNFDSPGTWPFRNLPDKTYYRKIVQLNAGIQERKRLRRLRSVHK